jgi:hypothetical protein
MEIPKEFFTLQSMLTLTGATGAVFVICNGLQAALNFNPKWLALAIALIISILGVVQTGGKGIDYFVGVVNGFLIFCTASGATAITGNRPDLVSRDAGVIRGRSGQASLPQRPNVQKRSFLTSWF